MEARLWPGEPGMVPGDSGFSVNSTTLPSSSVRYYGLFAVANRALLSKARKILGYNEIEPKEKIKKVFICRECKKEMIIRIVIPRPVRRSFSEGGPASRCNKAPPKMNGSFDNLSLNRCA